MLDTINSKYKEKQTPSTSNSQTSQQTKKPVISKKVDKHVPLYKRFLNTFSNTNVTNNSELKVYFSEPVIVSESNFLIIGSKIVKDFQFCISSLKTI